MIQDAARELETQWEQRRPLERDRAHVHGRGRRPSPRLRRRGAHARAARRGAPVAADRGRQPVQRARRAHRRPGRPDGAGGPRGDLPLRLAGRRRREPRRRDVSRPEPLSGEQRAARSSAASTTRCSVPTRSTGRRAGTGRTGSRRSSPTRRRASAAPLNAYELMRAMIEAGAAGVHYEDQLASEKKCGHLGGKVLVPTQQFVRTLNAARLAADVLRRPDGARRADGCALGAPPHERRRRVRPRLRHRRADERRASTASATGSTPRSRAGSRTRRTPTSSGSRPRRRISARRGSSREAIHERFPGKPLAYNCSPSFNWRKHLSDDEIASFQDTLGEWGYRFLFITLAGFHSLNAAMFELASGYRRPSRCRRTSAAGARVRARGARLHGDPAPARGRRRLLRLVAQAVAPGSETLALKGSTEEAQFTKEPA